MKTIIILKMHVLGVPLIERLRRSFGIEDAVKSGTMGCFLDGSIYCADPYGVRLAEIDGMVQTLPTHVVGLVDRVLLKISELGRTYKAGIEHVAEALVYVEYFHKNGREHTSVKIEAPTLESANDALAQLLNGEVLALDEPEPQQ